jgi:5-methylcytosine-specific restriction endonuclease McrA
MPIKPENKSKYPSNWKKISKYIRYIRAKNKCEFCGVENYTINPRTGSKVILTVAHLDHNPANCDFDNLKALCQKCHNKYDAKHRAETRKNNV